MNEFANLLLEKAKNLYLEQAFNTLEGLGIKFEILAGKYTLDDVYEWYDILSKTNEGDTIYLDATTDWIEDGDKRSRYVNFKVLRDDGKLYLYYDMEQQTGKKIGLHSYPEYCGYNENGDFEFSFEESYDYIDFQDAKSEFIKGCREKYSIFRLIDAILTDFENIE